MNPVDLTNVSLPAEDSSVGASGLGDALLFAKAGLLEATQLRGEVSTRHCPGAFAGWEKSLCPIALTSGRTHL